MWMWYWDTYSFLRLTLHWMISYCQRNWRYCWCSPQWAGPQNSPLWTLSTWFTEGRRGSLILQYLLKLEKLELNPNLRLEDIQWRSCTMCHCVFRFIWREQPLRGHWIKSTSESCETSHTRFPSYSGKICHQFFGCSQLWFYPCRKM